MTVVELNTRKAWQEGLTLIIELTGDLPPLELTMALAYVGALKAEHNQSLLPYLPN